MYISNITQLQNLALDKIAAITSMNLRLNNFGQLDIPELQAIFTPLSQATSLQSLNLRCTDLGRLNAVRLQAIFTPLSQAHALQSIDLSLNDLDRLDTVRLQAIFTPLSQAPSLQSIDLSFNKLYQLDAIYLQATLTLLSQAPTLQSINLNFNFLGQQDAICLLQSSKSLLTIKGINIEPDSLLQQILEDNRSQYQMTALALYDGLRKRLNKQTGTIFNTVYKFLPESQQNSFLFAQKRHMPGTSEYYAQALKIARQSSALLERFNCNHAVQDDVTSCAIMPYRQRII